jgi:hypothetical protein
MNRIAGGRVWRGTTKQAFDAILGEKSTARKSKRQMRLAKRVMKRDRNLLRELAKR